MAEERLKWMILSSGILGVTASICMTINFQDVLNALKELSDRSKNVTFDHTKAIEKMDHIKAKRLHGALASDPEIFNRVENKIASQENELNDLESRQKFYDYCLAEETATAFSYAGK